MKAVRGTWLVLPLVMALACSRVPVRVDDLNVVLVILDAAGARYLGTYGNPLPTSRNVDALGREGGVVFERAYAQSAWTLPSAASFLTGRYPPRRAQRAMVVRGPTLATAARDAGLRTAAFSESPYVTAPFGFDAGFDVFREYFPAHLLDENPRFYRVETTNTVADALDWVSANRAARFFLYLHLLAPHSPYQPPPPFARRFDPGYTGAIEGITDTLLRINEGVLEPTARDLEHLRLAYQENLAYGDDLVGRLVDLLRRTGLLERTVVIVAADHGEAFREHGVMLHTATLYEELIHVPLVIRFPSRFGKLPRRWTDIVELRDLVPTVCDALRWRCDASGSRSLLRRIRAPASSASVARAWTSDGARVALGALVTGRHKLVLDSRARRLALYDLRGDPGERHDLAGANVRLARRLARRLRAPRDAAASGTAAARPADETARKLRALGYTQ